jgi:UDPglucose 6-dehydrogenase
MGKLGLTCSLVLEKHGGFEVAGYDPSELPRDIISGVSDAPKEEGIAELLDSTGIMMQGTPGGVVRAVTDDNVIFVAVQTPHAPEYGGEVPAPAVPRDFEYGYLVQAVKDLSRAALEQQKPVVLAVVSTCLPGTVNRLVKPVTNEFVSVVYNPAFIAMGTTIADFLNPEFVLLGADRQKDANKVAKIYDCLHDKPLQIMSIESAELTKIAYNVVISAKIVVANTLMEIADKTGADVDEVSDALALATDRVASGKYLRGGMGDGGHCHPRDLIAMCWLTERLKLSSGLLCDLSQAREDQSAWLADLTERWADQSGLKIHILGKSYKPESSLTGGSPALLLASQLRTRGREVDHWDPYVDGQGRVMKLLTAGVYVIGTMHEMFTAPGLFPAGSVVIDPHGRIRDQPGVVVIRVGRKS